jgi:ATP-dependent DNA helicase RecG
MALERVIPERESLTVEFKSDRRRLSDAELVAAAVCLANTDGGEIFLGVEDDGTIVLSPGYMQNTATSLAYRR